MTEEHNANGMPEQSSSPTIRPAQLQDVEIIAAFNTQIALETEDLVLDPPTVTAGVTAIIQDPNKGQYFVAEIDGKVVSQTMITYEWSDWKNGNVWWIQSVYVAPDYRRRGIFRALYSHVKKEAKRHGAPGLKLYAYHNNDKAHATYEALGMHSHNVVFEDNF